MSKGRKRWVSASISRICCGDCFRPGWVNEGVAVCQMVLVRFAAGALLDLTAGHLPCKKRRLCKDDGWAAEPTPHPRSVEKGWAVQYWEVLCKIRKKQCHYECKTLEKAPLRCRRDNDQKSMTITQGNNAIIGREASSSILWHLIIEFTQKTHANKKQRTNH